MFAQPIVMRAWMFERVMVCGLAVGLAGCAADTYEDGDDWDESLESATSSEISIPGRWIAPASVLSAGDRQSVRYDDAPAWNGGRSCGGGLLPGARELSDYLRRSFSAVSSIEGYACRPNTANTSRLSVHGTGRAIDVFIPLSRGGADNTGGDAVAHWLIANAQSIGVQFIVWDRSSWGASRSAGSKLRPYTGPHPHNDHLHVELTLDAAARRTPWFRDHGVAPTPPAPTPPAPTPPAPTPPAPTPPAPTPPAPTPPAPTPPAPTPPAPSMRVNTAGLNLRSGPGTAYRVITAMSCGDSVTVLSAPSGSWQNIRFGSTSGWASSSYLIASGSFSSAVCR